MRDDLDDVIRKLVAYRTLARQEGWNVAVELATLAIIKAKDERRKQQASAPLIVRSEPEEVDLYDHSPHDGLVVNRRRGACRCGAWARRLMAPSVR